VVRKKAVEIISNLSEDDFIDLLPQLVQSLKYDNYLNSPLSKLLLEKVVSSPRIAHYLYWSLLPLSTDSRFGYKYHQLMLALQVLCGEEMAMEFSQQADLIHSLSDVAMLVKGAKDQQRQTTLVHQLQRLASSLNPTFRLPINPALQCCDIDIEVT
jgi:phosphatidylinositol-4-phosphate 3-kinase